MPGTKRTTKVVSYNEEEDDDDFIPLTDVNKKSRPSKSKDSSTDSKPSKTTIQSPPEKCLVKLSKIAQAEPTVVQKPSEESNIADPIVIDDQEISSSPSEVSSVEDEIVSKKTEDQDENLSPVCKRTKHNQEHDEQMIADANSIDGREDMTEKIARTITDPPSKGLSGPFGFPTSKINISSPHTSRVGLSRKSATIKPLHPTFTSRAVHE